MKQGYGRETRYVWKSAWMQAAKEQEYSKNTSSKKEGRDNARTRHNRAANGKGHEWRVKLLQLGPYGTSYKTRALLDFGSSHRSFRSDLHRISSYLVDVKSPRLTVSEKATCVFRHRLLWSWSRKSCSYGRKDSQDSVIGVTKDHVKDTIIFCGVWQGLEASVHITYSASRLAVWPIRIPFGYYNICLSIDWLCPNRRNSESTGLLLPWLPHLQMTSLGGCWVWGLQFTAAFPILRGIGSCTQLGWNC